MDSSDEQAIANQNKKMAEEKEIKEKEAAVMLEEMQKPKFYLEGEGDGEENGEQDPTSHQGLIALPIEEPLVDDPSDQSHPHTTEKALDPDKLTGVTKVFAKCNWAWKVKKYPALVQPDGQQYD